MGVTPSPQELTRVESHPTPDCLPLQGRVCVSAERDFAPHDASRLTGLP
jgi:hypothetical protein